LIIWYRRSLAPAVALIQAHCTLGYNNLTSLENKKHRPWDG
jgi:hypothetical protein